MQICAERKKTKNSPEVGHKPQKLELKLHLKIEKPVTPVAELQILELLFWNRLEQSRDVESFSFTEVRNWIYLMQKVTIDLLEHISG